MNVQLDLRMDKPEFLAWVQTHEGRYELAGDRVVMMTAASRGHAMVVRRLATALEKRLDGNRWTVLTSDFGVDLGIFPRSDRSGGTRRDHRDCGARDRAASFGNLCGHREKPMTAAICCPVQR